MRRHALVASSLAMTLVFLNNSLVNVALPEIGRTFDVSVTTLQWIVDAYALMLGSLLLTAGALADRIGARRLLLIGVAVFATGSGASALASGAGTLIAAQALAGAGAAMLVPSSLALIAHNYRDPVERGRAIGIWASVSAAAFAASPVLGGLLIELAGWRAVFAVLVPFGLCAAALTWWRVSETTTTKTTGIDAPGQVLAIVTLASLTVAIIEAGAAGWGSARALIGGAVGVLAGIAFVLVERRTLTPMLPLRLFRSTTFSSAVAAGALMSFAMFAELFVLSLYLQSERGFTATEMGLLFLPQPAIGAAAGLFAGALMARFGTGAVMAVGGAFGAGGALVLTTLGATTGYGVMLVAFVLFGLAFALVVPSVMSAAVAAVEPFEVGVATSAVNASRQTGGVMGVAIAGSLVAGANIAAGAALAMGLASATMLGVISLGVLTHLAARVRTTAGAPVREHT